jgi:mono/diheme cytochrome c family protein
MRRSNNPTSELGACGVIGAAALALFCADGLAHPGQVGVTWTGTIARLLDTHCVACHGEGGPSRPRLDDYESARLASGAITRSVLTRHMPRWYAVSGFGEFANDRALTPNEIELVAQWADGGAPYGDPLLFTPRRGVPELAGPPDLILTVPSKHRIEQATHIFKLATGLADVRWIRGWTFRPGNPSLITAAVISLEGGKPLGTWVPGEAATFFPDGVTERLPAGTDVTLTIHYRKHEGAAVDASGVGLYFANRSPRELGHLYLPCGSTRLRRSMDALAIRPRIGSSAWSLAVVARYSDGRTDPLASFQNYPGDHARTYWFSDPVSLPRGTSIEVGATRGTCGAELEYVPSSARVLTRAFSAAPSANSLREDPDPSASSTGSPAAYWCPMHAHIRAASPGRCSECGMTLVPVTPEIEGKYRLDVDLIPSRDRGGEARTLRLVVRTPVTNAIVRRFEMMHERPFHLFVVSDDLREFFHLHPVARPDGSLELPRAPLSSGPYQVYADFLPAAGTPQMIRKTVMPTPVPRGFAGSPTPHVVPDLSEKVDGGLRVRIEPDPAAFIAGRPGLIAFHLSDASTGAPISDLEPYLGAWGHAFIVSADMADAVHSHPLAPLTSAGGPSILFQQRFPRAGSYRLWVQFKRGGSIATVSFTVAVVDGVGLTTQ